MTSCFCYTEGIRHYCLRTKGVIHAGSGIQVCTERARCWRCGAARVWNKSNFAGIILFVTPRHRPVLLKMLVAREGRDTCTRTGRELRPRHCRLKSKKEAKMTH